jgi:hypothetical protein
MTDHDFLTAMGIESFPLEDHERAICLEPLAEALRIDDRRSALVAPEGFAAAGAEQAQLQRSFVEKDMRIVVHELAKTRHITAGGLFSRHNVHGPTCPHRLAPFHRTA